MSRVRSDKFTNRAATGPCTFTDGLTVTDTTGASIGVNIGMGGIVAVAGTFSGDVSVAGTITYEDVQNVDSTGIVTAKGGVKVPEDNITVAVGPSDELSLWHSDTSHSYIQNTTGTLYIRSKSDETAMSIVPDGKVDLRYDGSVKVETTNDGVVVTGIATADQLVGRHGQLGQNVKAGSYTLVLADAGQYINNNATTVCPASIFSAGDVISIYNDSGSNITIEQDSGLTMYLSDGNATTGNRTLAQRCVCTVLYLSSTHAVISGGGLT